VVYYAHQAYLTCRHYDVYEARQVTANGNSVSYRGRSGGLFFLFQKVLFRSFCYLISNANVREMENI